MRENEFPSDKTQSLTWPMAYSSYVILKDFDVEAFASLIGRPSSRPFCEVEYDKNCLAIAQDPQGFCVAPLGTSWMTFAHAQARMPYLSRFATAILVYESNEMGIISVWQVWQSSRCVRSIANSGSDTHALPGKPVFNAKKVRRESCTGGPICEIGHARDDDPDYFDDYMPLDALSVNCLRLGILPSDKHPQTFDCFRLPTDSTILEW